MSTSAIRALRLRQPISGLTHLAGALLAIAGMFVLLKNARTSLHAVSFFVFSVSMLLVYLASSLYHLLPLSEIGTARLRRLDHSMIYVFIAGTYTPVCLVALNQSSGLPMLALVWTMTVAGVALKLFWLESSRWLRTALYVALGALSVVILPELARALSLEAFAWLLLGALIYAAGAIVYALKKPDPIPDVFGFHEIWHLFVLAGSFCHFWFVQRYLPHLGGG